MFPFIHMLSSFHSYFYPFNPTFILSSFRFFTHLFILSCTHLHILSLLFSSSLFFQIFSFIFLPFYLYFYAFIYPFIPPTLHLSYDFFILSFPHVSFRFFCHYFIYLLFISSFILSSFQYHSRVYLHLFFFM